MLYMGNLADNVAEELRNGGRFVEEYIEEENLRVSSCGRAVDVRVWLCEEYERS
jgi:hypothetical protein